MSGECECCMELFTTSKKRMKVSCGCGYEVCALCVKTYLLDSSKDPHCMSCDKGFSWSFLCENLGSSWVNGAFKKHRSTVALEKEMSRLSTAQPAAKRFLEIEKAEADYREIQKLIRDLGRQLYQKKDIIQELRYKKPTEKRHFIKPCGVEGCKGFLSSAYKCGLCDCYSCPKCHVVKGKDKDVPHECNPDDIASVEEIKKTTRNCPGCGAATFKTEGCDQMFCTMPGCETAFSFRTGRRETGRVHNPHYFEMLQRGELGGGGAAGGVRAPGDLQCGGPPGRDLIIAVLTFAGGFREFSGGSVNVVPGTPRSNNRGSWCEVVVNDILRGGEHFTAIIVDPLRERVAGARDNEDLRVKFLLNRIDEKKMKSTISRREKKREIEQAMLHIAELYSAVIQDQLFRITYGFRNGPNRSELPQDIKQKSWVEVKENIMEAIREVERMRQYCNNELGKIASEFKIKQRTIPKQLGTITRW